LLRRARRGDGIGSLVELRRLATLIARDPRIDGVLLHVPDLKAGWATCTTLRDALVGLRAAGKRVVSYLPKGGGNREFYVAWAGDRVLITPNAPVSLLGVGSQSLYLKPLLDRIGVRAEVHAHGEYKTAAEPMLREAMSEPQREQLSALIAGVQDELVAAAASRPGFDIERARTLFERGVWGAEAALEQGVVDATCYEDELVGELTGESDPRARPWSSARYLAWRTQRLWRRVRSQPVIAVVQVHGTITDSASALPTTQVAVQRTIVGALRRARRSSRARAVLLHVDSPGGSALASDLIHRELLRLREKKPIVAYFGDVAASGGYYVGAPCQRIVAQPTTVTGSIGVVSLRMLLGDVVERVGVRPQILRGMPHSDMGSPFRPLDADEQEMLRIETDAIYRRFVRVVAEGRGRSLEQIDEIARGRVWSGADALKRGLIDELGGFDRAVAVLTELAPDLKGLTQDEVALQLWAGPASEPPPASAPAAAIWSEVVQRIPSEVREVLHFFGGQERALYYASIPRLW
jgi:protease-4